MLYQRYGGEHLGIHDVKGESDEKGISSSNIEDHKNGSDEEIRMILGSDGDLGSHLGLSNDFADRIIKHIGNY